MPLLAAVAFITFLGCAMAGMERDFSRGVIATLQGAVAIAAIALPRPRAAIFEALKRFSRPAAAYCALMMLAAVMSGAFFVGASADPWRAEQSLVALAGAGFFFAAATGASTAGSRNRMLAALLVVPVALTLLIILDRFDGQLDFFGLSKVAPDNRLAGPFATPNEAATAFALFALLAAFAIVDELTRRPVPRGTLPPPALAQRLFLPATAFVASLNLLALTGSRAGIAAGVAGLAIYFGIAWLRGLKGRSGPRLVPIAAAAVSVIAIFVTFTAGAGALKRYAGAPTPTSNYSAMTSAALDAWKEAPLFGHGLGAYELLPVGDAGASNDAVRWLAEAGLVGTGLALAALGGLLFALWSAKDHGRRPTRGFALGAGIVATVLIQGLAQPALSSPAIGAVFAALLGLAAAYVDPGAEASKIKPSARTRVLS
jgi:O-antigen ligase